MDPLSALSIAASAVQFIQFGCSLVSKSQEIYKSNDGKTLEHNECEKAVERLLELTGKLEAPPEGTGIYSLAAGIPGSDGTGAIRDICDNCIAIAKELLAGLETLKVDEDSSHRKWKSFRQALKSIFSKSDLEKLEGRLLACRKELDSHLIANIRNEIQALSLGTRQILSLLDSTSREIIQQLLDNHELLRKDFLDQTILLIQSNESQHSESSSRLLSAAEGQVKALQQRLLGSLHFGAREARHTHSGVEGPHAKTFEWIFMDTPNHLSKWDSFVNWLQSGSGVYWINGKAGSGKSTLMSFIVENPHTARLLEIWSQGSKMTLASFFFWKGGLTLQRSQAGLFRSLLYEALKDRPDVVPLIFPREWSWAKTSIASGENVIQTLDFEWSLKELQEAFQLLITLANDSMAFCFFIDGLDEYEGDKEKLAMFCKTLSASPHVKLCISSRPLLVFEDSFCHCPALKLQDLTFNDIRTFVRDELEEHPRMLRLTQANPAHAIELVSEIVEKANGVFLWVKLVVSSLVRGLQNRDEISDLRIRVNNLPDDLSSLYTVMLHQVEPMYTEQSSQIFQVYHAMVEVEGTGTGIAPLDLELALTATSETAFTASLGIMNQDEMDSRSERIDALLRSRCAGLLEVQVCRISAYGNFPSKSESYTTKSSVGYLHSTVKEFLETEEVRDRLSADTASKPDFEPYTSILMSYIIKLKRTLYPPNDPYEWSNEGRQTLWKTRQFALEYALKAENSHALAYIPLLDELDRLLSKLWLRDEDGWVEYSRSIWPELEIGEEHRKWQSNLLTTAVSVGLFSYVKERIEQNPRVLRERTGLPLLTYALRIDLFKAQELYKMGELLLAHGADPNQLWCGNSPWQKFLTISHTFAFTFIEVTAESSALERLLPPLRIYLLNIAKVFELLLRYGASPHATCTYNHTIEAESVSKLSGWHTVEDVLTDLFTHATRLPHETAELLHLLHSKMESQHGGRDEVHGDGLLFLSGSETTSNFDETECHNRHASTIMR